MEKEIVLNNGVKIPRIGFGTHLLKNGDETINSVKCAIENGFRHIDTATTYWNEASIGEALKQINIDRKELFITTKRNVWLEKQGYNETIKNFNESLKRLGLDYLDLYLIHSPIAWGHNDDWQNVNIDTWRAMETLYKEGKIKAIGVSNFAIEHLEPLLQEADVVPTVNQLELHPQWQQREIVDYCKKHNITLEAWGALGQGKIFDNDNNNFLKEIAQKYNKTEAQVLLRWSIQKDFVPLVKSRTPERIKENINVFDFELDNQDMFNIDAINNRGGNRGIYSGFVPSKLDASNDIYYKKPEKEVYKLFNFIPLIKIKRSYKGSAGGKNICKIYLFNFIKILTITIDKTK